MTSLDIFNLYRSIYGFKHILLNLKGVGEIKIVELSNFDVTKWDGVADIDSSKLVPGDLVYHKKLQKLLAYCFGNSFIEIKKLTLVEKKKNMTGVDLNNGFLKKHQLCLQV